MASQKKSASNQNTLWLWLALGIVVILSAAYFINNRLTHPAGAITQMGVLPDVNTVPPDFTLKGLDGKTYTLSALKGRPIWINFWATWCTWCKKEAPFVEAAHTQLGDKILLLGIDQGEGPNTIKSKLADFGITYPVLLDRDQSVDNSYGIRGIPTSIFINAQGKVTAVQEGAFTDEQTALNDAEQAIAGGNG